MAVNVTVYDLDNYPDNSKTVTVNHSTLVPIGYEGDEQCVLSFTTTAYSDNTNTTSIQDIYVRETRAGWCKSSGLVGTGGKFTIVSGIGGDDDGAELQATQKLPKGHLQSIKAKFVTKSGYNSVKFIYVFQQK